MFKSAEYVMIRIEIFDYCIVVFYHVPDIVCVQLSLYYFRAAAVHLSLSCVASFLLAV